MSFKQFLNDYSYEIAKNDALAVILCFYVPYIAVGITIYLMGVFPEILNGGVNDPPGYQRVGVIMTLICGSICCLTNIISCYFGYRDFKLEHSSDQNV